MVDVIADMTVRVKSHETRNGNPAQTRILVTRVRV